MIFLEFYEKVTAFKKKGIKVLIAIGGWNDSAGDKYSRLVNNAASRRRFIEHVVGFIEANNFDGLDLDWEYPKCWQVSLEGVSSKNKVSSNCIGWYRWTVKKVRNLTNKPSPILYENLAKPSNQEDGYYQRLFHQAKELSMLDMTFQLCLDTLIGSL